MQFTEEMNTNTFGIILAGLNSKSWFMPVNPFEIPKQVQSLFGKYTNHIGNMQAQQARLVRI